MQWTAIFKSQFKRWSIFIFYVIFISILGKDESVVTQIKKKDVSLTISEDSDNAKQHHC